MYMQYTHPARSGQMGLACQVVSKKEGLQIASLGFLEY